MQFAEFEQNDFGILENVPDAETILRLSKLKINVRQTKQEFVASKKATV